MEWQAIVLAMQIMLLAVGWLLFQKARGELSARAAETPVLAEVKALQRSVKLLLAEIETTADRNASRLEQRCEEARLLTQALDSRLADAEEVLRLETFLPQEPQTAIVHNMQEKPARTDMGRYNAPASPKLTPQEQRRQTIFHMADAGESLSAIARETKLSEGEVETLLALRSQRR